MTNAESGARLYRADLYFPRLCSSIKLSFWLGNGALRRPVPAGFSAGRPGSPPLLPIGGGGNP